MATSLQDRKGVFKDTKGDTQADDEVYNLIMKNKERLLSIEEPLRFIFSHSALREGWDNPNVFQICTLNETHSAMKKRQEIGRGLRLPVDQWEAGFRRIYQQALRHGQRDLRRLCPRVSDRIRRGLWRYIRQGADHYYSSRLVHVVDGEETTLGRDTAEIIKTALVEQKMLATDVVPAETRDRAPGHLDGKGGCGGDRLGHRQRHGIELGLVGHQAADEPWPYASSAVITRPVRARSAATPCPAIWNSRETPPESGMTPWTTSGSIILVPTAAIRMSHRSARSNAPPMTQPFRAQTMGTAW